MNLTFRLPLLKDECILHEYIKEHISAGEKSLSANRGLKSMPFTDWVSQINQNVCISQNIWGKTYTYLCFDSNKLIGLLDIRCDLSEENRWIYGDIGYGVRPIERRKSYATLMLKYALSVCKEHNMNNVILGCYKDNTASSKTILNNGGKLLNESDNYTKGKISQYYIIDL